MRTVCFDLDGVIIHSSDVQRHAFFESYYQVLGEYPSEEKMQDFFNHSGDSLSNIFQKMNIPLEMVDIYRKISIEKQNLIKLHPGIKELLEDLNTHNIQCTLCTGKDHERTMMILKNLHIHKYFNGIVCSDDVQNPKPHAESLWLLMKTLDIKKENMIMVGDAANDIKCAQNACITSVAVTWGEMSREILLQSNPDYIVDNIEELYAVLTE